MSDRSTHNRRSLRGALRMLLLSAAVFLAGSLAQGCGQAPSAPSAATLVVYGAAGQVSGSLSVLDTGNGRFMIDCGAFTLETVDRPDGVREQQPPQAAAPLAAMPVDPRSIDAVFLTHVHIDHVGRLPLLVEGGFSGPIYLTAPTAELLPIMLPMQIRYDEQRVRRWVWSEAARRRAKDQGRALTLHWHPQCRYRNAISPQNLASAQCSLAELRAKLSREGPPVETAICRQCAEREVAAILALCRRVEYDAPWEAAPGVRVTLRYAGHIPGSASILFELALKPKPLRVLFSGDVGNDLSPLFPGPKPAPAADALVIETTYGPTFRPADVRGQRAVFRRDVAATVQRGGIVWVPVFALDRAQKILHELRLAQQEGLLPEGVPIYCSSPSAMEITGVYRQHQASGWFRDPVARDADAFWPSGLRKTPALPERLPRPCVLVTTAGMLGHGASRALLPQLLPDKDTRLCLVTYQDPASAGGLLKAGAKSVELDGRTIPVLATVSSYGCFSGHADAHEMDAWLANARRDARLVLVHGGSWELPDRASQLTAHGWTRVLVARPGEAIDLLRGK